MHTGGLCAVRKFVNPAHLQFYSIVVFDRRKDKLYCHNIYWEIMMAKICLFYYLLREFGFPPHLGVLPVANLKDLYPSYCMPYILCRTLRFVLFLVDDYLRIRYRFCYILNSLVIVRYGSY